MKFLTCSRCLSIEPPPQPTIQEITNPLVMTKRPVPKVHPQKSKPKSKSSPSPRKKRFPALLSALTSWPRRRQPQTKIVVQQQQQHHHSSPRMKTVRVLVSDPTPAGRRRTRHRPPTRTQRLIRMYEERAGSPEGKNCLYQEEYVIDPPASFSGGDDSLESHQNFKNKLNTLDFKRMNTVALEAPASPTPSRTDSAIYRKNSYVERDSGAAVPIGKFARKTLLEDFLRERLRIEQTMIDLLNGRDPGSVILKKSRNDDKKVRFKVDAMEKELRVDVTGEGKVGLTDDGRVEQETEIKLSVDPSAKVEDFYVEKRTTFLKDKTVEDKALVLKIAAKDELEAAQDDEQETIGRKRELVFRNFGKMSL